jgi:hypothetical protein
MMRYGITRGQKASLARRIRLEDLMMTITEGCQKSLTEVPVAAFPTLQA